MVDDDEVLVARRGSRVPPQLLSLDTMALLEHFRAADDARRRGPRVLRRRGADPMSTLDDAFGVLVALTRSDILVADGTAPAESLRGAAPDRRAGRPGDAHRPHPGAARQRDLARGPGGRLAGRRQGRRRRGARARPRRTRARRARPARRLRRTPARLARAVADRRHAGARRGRRRPGRPGDPGGRRRRAPRIAQRCSTRTSALHERGRPARRRAPGQRAGRTGLPRDAGRLRPGRHARRDPPPRPGGGEYLDPPAAAALRAGDPDARRSTPPPSSTPSRRSRLPAAHRRARPLDLACERDEALRRIVEDRPRPFVAVGATPCTGGRARAAPGAVHRPRAPLPLGAHVPRRVRRGAAAPRAPVRPTCGDVLAALDVTGPVWSTADDARAAHVAWFLDRVADPHRRPARLRPRAGLGRPLRPRAPARAADRDSLVARAHRALAAAPATAVARLRARPRRPARAPATSRSRSTCSTGGWAGLLLALECDRPGWPSRRGLPSERVASPHMRNPCRVRTHDRFRLSAGGSGGI